MIGAIPIHTGKSAWQTSKCLSCGAHCTRKNAVHCPECHATLPRPIMRVRGRNRLICGFHNSTYRRMPSRSPAQTITTASGRIGGNYTIHPFENRVLSPLECAHLQTFPPDFQWGAAVQSCGITNVRAMIGEAVPPLFTGLHGAVLASLLRGSLSGSVRTEFRSLKAESLLGLDTNPID